MNLALSLVGSDPIGVFGIITETLSRLISPLASALVMFPKKFPKFIEGSFEIMQQGENNKAPCRRCRLHRRVR